MICSRIAPQHQRTRGREDPHRASGHPKSNLWPCRQTSPFTSGERRNINPRSHHCYSSSSANPYRPIPFGEAPVKAQATVLEGPDSQLSDGMLQTDNHPQIRPCGQASKEDLCDISPNVDRHSLATFRTIHGLYSNRTWAVTTPRPTLSKLAKSLNPAALAQTVFLQASMGSLDPPVSSDSGLWTTDGGDEDGNDNPARRRLSRTVSVPVQKKAEFLFECTRCQLRSSGHCNTSSEVPSSSASWICGA